MKYVKSLIFAVIISQLSITMYAQTIVLSGRVVTDNQTPIEFVNVLVTTAMEMY